MKKNLNYVLVVLAFLTFVGCVKTEQKYSDYPIKAVKVTDVEVSDNFWLPKINEIQSVTIPYSFNKCDVEGRMNNFLVAGGKKEGVYQGKMPFDDTDLYKIIEGASLSLTSHPNPALEAYIDSIIGIIAVGQEPDGYLTTWFTIDRQNPPAWWVNPSTKRWENEQSSHEHYNSGHMFEAAAAHYRATGKRTFLDIAIKNADLLVQEFGPGKLFTPPGHQIIETGLIQLYHITGNEKYLELSKFFLDERGDSSKREIWGPYSQDHLPVVEQTEVVGHAVRAVYQYAGMTDIAVMYNDADYLNAVNALWENMVNKKMYITGGLGARHDGESFGDNYELPNKTAYSETCAAIGSVDWCHRLFLLTGQSKYFDVIERTLYNGLIAGISLDGSKFFYPNPLEADGEYRFNYGAATRQPWFDCSCCPTNLIRFIPSIPELIYAEGDNEIFINLFVSSNALLEIGKQNVVLEQETNYPYSGSVKIIVNPEKTSSFKLKVRIPGWAHNEVAPGDLYHYSDNNKGDFTLFVNGEAQPIELVEGYAQINRKWKKGDVVSLELPMMVRLVVTNPLVEENRGKVAFEYGPLVYCAEQVDNGELTDVKIPANIDFSILDFNVQDEETKALVAVVNGNELTLIPYFAWSNRGVGEMKVWFQTE
ncbi:MAG TPA: glycoside hydrolase family 127 protein [Prolixibacteraceae bacterium]|nr:glycoside hydrolase family 127 protein [Prolixibacteraceae bacterium]